MLSQLIKYSGIAVKTRAMSANHLTKFDYDQLCSMPNVTDVAVYLKNNTAYSEVFTDLNERSLHRGDIEALLTRHFRTIVEKIYKFINGKNREFLKYVFLRYEIESMKIILRCIKAGEPARNYVETNDFFNNHLSIDLNKLAQAKSITDFIEDLRGTQYQAVLSPILGIKERQDMFSIEMTLDMYYFKRVYESIDKELTGTDKQLAYHSLGSEIDVLNLMWIYRSKRYYNVPKEIIYTYLTPYSYKIEKKLLTAMVEAESIEEMVTIARKTPYAHLFDDLDNRFIEQNYIEFIYNLNKKMLKEEPYSIASMLVYIHFTEIEIKTITNIIEGIRYGLSSDEIKSLIRIGEII